MQKRILALSALAIASFPEASAFVAPAAGLHRIANVGASAVTARPTFELRTSRRASGLRAATSNADTGVPEGQRAFEAAERTMDEWFAILADR